MAKIGSCRKGGEGGERVRKRERERERERERGRERDQGGGGRQGEISVIDVLIIFPSYKESEHYYKMYMQLYLWPPTYV